MINMGLDMYLHKKTYIGNKWREPQKRVEVVIPEDESGVFSPAKGIKDERVSEITEEVAYWRKANAIHAWIVNNVQNGEDDCGEYFVDRGKLEKLLDVVNKVLEASELVDGEVTTGWKGEGGKVVTIREKGKVIKDPRIAMLLLPTQEGFFFGSTDYDQFYISGLQYTKQVLEEVLKEEGNYYYRASW